MQLFAGVANQRGQAALDVHVHVFERNAPVERACFDLLQDAAQAGHDLLAFGGGQHAHAPQHLGVGDGALNILTIQALVEADRGGKGLNKSVGGLAEASAPQSGVGRAGFGVLGHRVLFWPVSGRS